MHNIIDYPKLECPYVKVKHKVTPEVRPEFQWFLENGVRAVDKLHGTNICVMIQGSYIEFIDNRTQRVLQSCFIPVYGASHRFLIGVLNAIRRGWLKEDGRYYGELIGPDINNNLHQVEDYLFVPFDHLAQKYHWHSWIQNKYPKDFDTISDWFKELPSLFSLNCLKKNVLAEGLIFYGPGGKKCKLRRDMFDWYKE